ncbi:MAG: phage protein Gp27 family protein [Pseudodesulfovibrio sp.]|uniref:phage protein Gp27 family protein n=1 Tax=Pseudodesulfovibrio sp. TaxID=2035812 RepID=UPI003D133481
MPRQSSIKRLPPAIRDRIGSLLDQGRTLDEILTHLESLDVQVSRSALGRYKQHIDKVSERIRRSREVAEAIVRNQGDAPESKTARLNIELLHGVILDMISQLPDGADNPDSDDAQSVLLTLSPRGAMEMAKAMDHLARASKQDADLIAKLREEARAEAKAEMTKRVAELGSAEDIKSLSNEELEERILALTEG